MNDPSESFDRRKTLAVYWHNKACDLRGSAGVLWESMHAPDASARAEKLGLGQGFSFAVACWPVYQMLCGMALELLLKAILVARGSEPKAVHSLAALNEAAALPFSSKQHGLLRILSEAVIWDGRYPVPKDKKHFKEYAELRYEHLFDQVSSGKLKILRPNDKLGWQSFNELWDVAYTAYGQHHF
jgi:hypothetical protein